MTPVVHNYSHLAGRTVHWDTTDSEESYQRNLVTPVTRARLKQLGWIDITIDYSFNGDGFRNPEFDTVYDVLCFGCSFTMGTGVQASMTWPSQLQSLTGLQVANLGHAGSSNDTVFRFALHYLPKLRPSVAVWLQTDRHRIELIDDAGPTSLNIMASDRYNPCAHDYFTRTWFSSDTNQQLNLQKNSLAFRHLCDQLDIKSIIMPRETLKSHGLPTSGSARDLMHPGVDDYAEIAQLVASQL